MNMHKIILGVVTGIVLAVTRAACADSTPRPNVVLIMADDFGWGDLNANNPSRPFDRTISTPNLDALVVGGMRFDNFYSCGTVCTPTRASILTAIDTGHSLARGNAETVLRPESTTIGEVLQSANYSTHAFGKWGVGGVAPATTPFVDPAPVIQNGFALPTAQGFDEYVGIVDTLHAWNYWSSYVWQGDENNPLAPVAIPGNVGVNPATGPTPAQIGAAVNVDDLFTDSAINVINNHQPGDDPFFTYLNFITPHRTIASLPIDPLYANAGNPGDPLNPNGGAWPTIEKQFASALTALDQRVGEVVQALSDQGILDNTLILFTGDNGPQQTEGHQVEFFDGNGDLQGFKRAMYEGGIRTPLVAYWNGTIAGGQVNDFVGTHADFLPTLAELAGGAAPSGIDGISFATMLQGGAAPARSEPIYFEFWEGGFSQAARSGDWKIVRTTLGTIEIYDLSVDPSESNNLANTPAAAAVQASLEQFLSDRRNYTIQYDARYTQDAGATIEDTGGVANVRDYELRFQGDAHRVGPQHGDADVSAYPAIDHAIQFSGSGVAQSKGASVGGEPGGRTIQDVAFASSDATRADASVEVWFKPSDLIGQEVILELGGASSGLALVVDGDLLKLRIKDSVAVSTLAANLGDGLALPGVGQFGLGDFNQVVGVIDFVGGGANLALYLNGQQVSTSFLAGITDWAGADGDGLGGIRNTIGGDNGDLASFGGFDGLIAQFKFYEFALAEHQVLARYNQVIPEPSAYVLASIGAIGLLIMHRRSLASRRSASSQN